jgi:hypothetical protein
MSQRRIAVVGLVGLLIYVCWISWPYLEAIVVRDAAVTSWVSVTAAPISGKPLPDLAPNG